MGQITPEDLAIQPPPPGECAPFVFVITAHKDGGAMGYDEWALVAVCLDEEAAIRRRDEYVKARKDLRWWPTIRVRQGFGGPGVSWPAGATVGQSLRRGRPEPLPEVHALAAELVGDIWRLIYGRCTEHADNAGKPKTECGKCLAPARELAYRAALRALRTTTAVDEHGLSPPCGNDCHWPKQMQHEATCPRRFLFNADKHLGSWTPEERRVIEQMARERLQWTAAMRRVSATAESIDVAEFLLHELDALLKLRQGA